jgi:hypothetical protein
MCYNKNATSVGIEKISLIYFSQYHTPRLSFLINLALKQNTSFQT